MLTRKLMRLKPSAILFDMDGVLVDSLDSWLSSLNISLKEFGHKPISRDEFIKKYWGHDLFDNLKKMRIPVKVGTFCNNVYGTQVGKIRIYPETKDTLKKLAGYKKSVITNTPRGCAVHILKRFDIERYFKLVLTSDDVSVAKPDPEIVLKSCKLLDVDPRDVVLVGDTNSDVKAGKAAGCTVIGINVKADYTVKDVSGILTLIDLKNNL